MTKRLLSFMWLMLAGIAAAEEQPPNFVVLFADDLGYGDIQSYGHPYIRTPHIDQLAAEGTVFLNHFTQLILI